MANVCIFGDSITWGVNDEEKGGWANRLKNYFKEKAEIYNLGISGDNTNDLLKRFKQEAEQKKPNIIIFAIGINDSQYVNSKENNRVKINKFQENLNELLKQAKQFTNKIIFIGLTKVDETRTAPVSKDANKYYDNESIKKYDKIIKEFCEKNKLKYIPMFDLLTDKELDDGLHPGPEGHQKMFEIVKKALEKLHFLQSSNT